MKKLILALAIALSASTAFAATHVPPGAKGLDATDPMKTSIDIAKEQLAKQNGDKATVDAYVLPPGTTFDKVAEYYKGALTGWTEQAKMTQPTGGSATWTSATNEVLSVSFMNNMITPGGAPYLIVVEARPAH
jgi:hypothetical protein